jgi:hypothetical protein
MNAQFSISTKPHALYAQRQSLFACFPKVLTCVKLLSWLCRRLKLKYIFSDNTIAKDDPISIRKLTFLGHRTHNNTQAKRKL